MSTAAWLAACIGIFAMTETLAVRRQGLAQVGDGAKNEIRVAFAAIQRTEKALFASIAEAVPAVDKPIPQTPVKGTNGKPSSGTTQKPASMLRTVVGVLLFCAMLVTSAVVLLALWVGSAIKLALEGLDRKCLGVQITVDYVSVAPWSLRVDIGKLKVGNPVGSGYLSESMLSLDHILVDVSATELLSSWGRHVVVQKMVVDKLYTIVEKHSLHTSNVKEVVEFLARKQPSAGADAERDFKDRDQECKDGDQEVSKEVTLPEKAEKGRGISLREVKIQDVDLRFQIEHELFGKEHVVGTDLALSDIVYEDFSKEHGAKVIDDLAVILLHSVLKTILSNVAGKQVAGHFF